METLDDNAVYWILFGPKCFDCKSKQGNVYPALPIKGMQNHLSNLVILCESCYQFGSRSTTAHLVMTIKRSRGMAVLGFELSSGPEHELDLQHARRLGREKYDRLTALLLRAVEAKPCPP